MFISGTTSQVSVKFGNEGSTVKAVGSVQFYDVSVSSHEVEVTYRSCHKWFNVRKVGVWYTVWTYKVYL